MTYVEIAGNRYPAEVANRIRDPEWDNRRSKAITLSMTPAEAAGLFKDGVPWNIVRQPDSYKANGETVAPAEEVHDHSEYDVAGTITDNRDGTVTVKMGVLTDREAMTIVMGQQRPTRMKKAVSIRATMETLFEKAASDLTADEIIEAKTLCRSWEEGAHKTGEVYTADGQVWQCIQDYDNAVYPDIVPGNAAWKTFHKPYHGTTAETALPYVAPTGAHDMYLAGEYMVWTDGHTYKCLQGTAYSPAEYAAAWEVM